MQPPATAGGTATWDFFSPCCAVVLLGACLTLFAWHSGQVRPVIENPLVGALGITLALGCLARALSDRPGRLASLALGAGLFAFALGNLRVHPDSAASASSVAAGFSLLLYPLAFLALVLFVRSEPGRVTPTVWLDGVMASLGAAAIGTALALNTILAAAGGTPISIRGEPGASDRGRHLGGAGPRGDCAGAPASGARPALRGGMRFPGRR